MCYHYTTAAKNNNRQPFSVYSAFADIAIDSIQLHRFALTIILKWQQVATDRSWQQNSIAATTTSHMPVVSSTLKQPDKIHAWLHRGSATSPATTFAPLGTATCWSSGSQSTRHHRRPPTTITDHSPRLSRPSKNGIGFCKASSNGVFLWERKPHWNGIAA